MWLLSVVSQGRQRSFPWLPSACYSSGWASSSLPLRICVGISVDICWSPLPCLGPCDKVARVKGWTEDSKHSRWLQVSYLFVQHPDYCLNPLSDGEYQQVFENEYLWRKQGSSSNGTKSGISCATEVMKSNTEDCSPGLDNKNSAPHYWKLNTSLYYAGSHWDRFKIRMKMTISFSILYQSKLVSGSLNAVWRRSCRMKQPSDGNQWKASKRGKEVVLFLSLQVQTCFAAKTKK